MNEGKGADCSAPFFVSEVPSSCAQSAGNLRWTELLGGNTLCRLQGLSRFGRSKHTMPAFVIRPAQRRDLPAITAIYAQAVETGTASFELVPPDLEEMERRFDALVQGGYPYLVCLAQADDGDSSLLGYAYAGPYRPRPAYRATVENSVYVAESARRLGVGRALLSRLIEEATARDFRQMVAVIGDSAHVASIDLHRALGFATVGTLTNVGRKLDRWLDSVLMQRALGESADSPPRF